MCKDSQEAIQEAERARMLRVQPRCQCDPQFIPALPCQLWGLDDVTWLPSFNILVLKPGLEITDPQICGEDVTQ